MRSPPALVVTVNYGGKGASMTSQHYNCAYFQVRNWTQYQHYKKRNPPWIKLHAGLLTSEDWVSLDDSSRVLAVACMLIAAKNDGCVPNKPDYMIRVAYLSSCDFRPLVECGFLVPITYDREPEVTGEPEREKRYHDASTMLARRKHDASNLHRGASKVGEVARPETETETEGTSQGVYITRDIGSILEGPPEKGEWGATDGYYDPDTGEIFGEGL